MTTLAASLAWFEFAPATSFANLAMIPFLLKESRQRRYVTLDEALGTGRFRVTEVSEHGSVPTLHVHNELDTPVLLLDGEELVGAKQNRVVNLTILVPARAGLSIPVSCVEAGRWRHVAPEFSASGRAQFREARAHKQAQVTRSLALGEAMADQGDVWARISARASRLGVHAPTSAMHDIYQAQQHEVDAFVQALRPQVGQAGAAFAIEGRLAGVEFFDSAETMARLLPKIVGSYALDAVVAPREDRRHQFATDDVRRWFSTLAQVTPSADPSVGLGRALRWTGLDITAAALELEQEMMHFVGFPLDRTDANGPNGRRMRAASWRRAHRSE